LKRLKDRGIDLARGLCNRKAINLQELQSKQFAGE
jgi:hypothetical protein